MTGIAGKAAAGASPLTRLLAGAKRLGGVYQLDYESAVVITDDLVKRQCGGVPKHGFLMAAATVPTQETQQPLDGDEIILLRVKGTAGLPNEGELIATRLAAMRDANIREQRPEHVVDTLTSRQIEMSAFRCDVLGTFYVEKIDGKPFIQFGADIDTVYAGARYFVYTPSAIALSFIASYPEISEQELRSGAVPDLIELGTVRFSSTRRLAQDASLDSVPVRVRVTDFISRKTAVLGMTRAGKSNTNKTICTAVFKHSREKGIPIGQLIFDPQGEYANVNKQDKTGLRLLGQGADWVKVYKFGADPQDPQEVPLTANFFGRTELPVAWDMICDFSSTVDAGYAVAFRSAEIMDPNPQDFPGGDKDPDYHKIRTSAARGRFAFYSTLAKAGFTVPSRWPGIKFAMAGKLADAILADHPNALTKQSGEAVIRTGEGLKDTMTWLTARIKEKKSSAGLKPPYDAILTDLRTWENCKPWADISSVFDMSGGTAVLNRLKDFTEFHDPNASGDVVSKVAADLALGRIVIVDLSHGSERVGQVMSERVVNGLLEQANRRFRSGRDPLPIQIVVEEAHNLFDRNKALKNERDPWVVLAKQAAKYEIGLLYATQEVTSVDPRVLSNTHNYVVAHLNSDRETKELSHYYDFSTFAEDIRRAEDRGFVRMKTFSGKFIVPVQVAKFDHDMINAARAAAGLSAVTI
ncbi:DUF87 domain-containing protein [Frankia sp. B2]|nr:DUF87 domain-containing protein [Frankia sp. B2]